MRSWIILNKKEAEDQFWRYINFPEYFGRSMYEVRIGERDEKVDRDIFVERWMFQIFYNPIEDKYRIYLNTGNSKSLPHDPDPIVTNFIDKIDRYFVDGLDFTNKIYTI